jgi:hypothetical protein
MSCKTATKPAPTTTDTTVALVADSNNTKTGHMPVSTSDMSTCPERCAFLNVCYANFGHTIYHWRTVPQRGTFWAAFVAKVAAFPKGQLWRHNEAGDLPARKGRIDAVKLRALVKANRGRRGFTYTHHELTEANIAAIRYANDNGFTINVSCETVGQVDYVRALGLPAVLATPKGEPVPTQTPNGNSLRICPAVTSAEAIKAGRDVLKIQCTNCGICYRHDRVSTIVFPAHGPGAKRVGEAIFKVRLAEVTGGVSR